MSCLGGISRREPRPLWWSCSWDVTLMWPGLGTNMWVTLRKAPSRLPIEFVCLKCVSSEVYFFSLGVVQSSESPELLNYWAGLVNFSDKKSWKVFLEVAVDVSSSNELAPLPSSTESWCHGVSRGRWSEGDGMRRRWTWHDMMWCNMISLIACNHWDCIGQFACSPEDPNLKMAVWHPENIGFGVSTSESNKRH